MLDSNWHKVPNNLRDLLPDRIERDVYEVLLEHSNKDGYSYPSIRRISEKIHASPSTVIKKIHLLEQKKFIKIQKKKGEHNTYKILPIEGVEFDKNEEYLNIGEDLSKKDFLNQISAAIERTVSVTVKKEVKEAIKESIPEIKRELLQSLLQNENSEFEKPFTNIILQVLQKLLQNQNTLVKQSNNFANSSDTTVIQPLHSKEQTVTPLLYSEDGTVTPLLQNSEPNKKYNKTYLTIQEQDIYNKKIEQEKERLLSKEREFGKDWLLGKEKEKKENLIKERKESLVNERLSGKEGNSEKDYLSGKPKNLTIFDFSSTTPDNNNLETKEKIEKKKSDSGNKTKEKKEKEIYIASAKEKERKEKTLAKRPSAPPCPHDEIIALYHEILPMLPKVRIWRGKRRKSLEARWKEEKERQNLDWWREYFEYVRQSDFLTGKKTDFRADLEWLVGVENMAKILNGRYHTKKREVTYDDYLEFEKKMMGNKTIDIDPKDVTIEDITEERKQGDKEGISNEEDVDSWIEKLGLHYDPKISPELVRMKSLAGFYS